MAVTSVFISSVQRGFEAEREAARRAVNSLRLHPLMAEDEPASPDSPRRALLDRVAEAEIFLLIVGPHYGQAGPNGVSPTEDEFREAQRLGRPTVVLAHEGDMEPEQRAFLDRVTDGGWNAGKLYSRFTDAGDLALQAAAALARLMSAVVPEDASAAQARAAELAAGEQRPGMSAGVLGRVALVPTAQRELLDALSLERPDLTDALAAAARSSGLAAQQIGLKADVTSARIALTGSEPDDWVPVVIVLGVDGAVTAQGPVSGSGQLGGMVVSPSRLGDLLAATGRFALSAWQEIDQHEQIRQAAAAVAIPDASYKGFADDTGSSLGLGGHIPDVVVAPEPAVVVDRRALGDASWVRGTVAAVRRVFLDQGRG
jgi:hypothetical protein